MAEQSRRFGSLDKPIDKFMEQRKKQNKTKALFQRLEEFLNFKNESDRIELEFPP